ncbi:MAG: cyclic nucleotide-binding domain-containing protein [Deltaproteobacteria bacterium]|nr:cyclic nucleotide-binding domain-containing protein [Deltaproteobacteria bacterium]
MTTPWARLFGYKKSKHSDNHSTIKLLSEVPIFEELNRRELAAIERILHHREYQRGEIIFRQGERGAGMYIVLRGKVAVVSEPDQQELSEMRDGDFFGEVALLDETPRTATVIAKTDCSVFGFFQPDLFDLIARDSRLGVKIVLRVARIASQRLRQANERVIALTAELDAMKRTTPDEAN